MEKFRDVHKKHSNEVDSSKPSMAVDASSEEVRRGYRSKPIQNPKPMNDGESMYPHVPNEEKMKGEV